MLTEEGGVGGEFRSTPPPPASKCTRVASDGAGRFLVLWSGFVGGATSYEIMGQRYSGEQQLVAPRADDHAADSYSLMISWSPLAGYPDLAGYRLFVDAATALFSRRRTSTS
jgi:hypothetical protein